MHACWVLHTADTAASIISSAQYCSMLMLHGADTEMSCNGLVARLSQRSGRIPLKDVIRFKERQWFLEEIEVRLAVPWYHPGKHQC